MTSVSDIPKTDRLRITEIFCSIQGESSTVGFQDVRRSALTVGSQTQLLTTTSVGNIATLRGGATGAAIASLNGAAIATSPYQLVSVQPLALETGSRRYALQTMRRQCQ